MVLRSRDGASRRRLLLLNALLVASALVTAAVAVRVVVTQSDGTSGLVWNLFLAWIPFLLALGVYDAARRRASAWTLAGLGALWLLFLPNAPYIVTDFKWLRAHGADVLVRPADDRRGRGARARARVRLGVPRPGRRRAAARPAGGLGDRARRARPQRSGRLPRALPALELVGGGDGAVEDLRRARARPPRPVAHAEPLALSAFFAVACCGGYALFYSLFRPHLHRLEDR